MSQNQPLVKDIAVAGGFKVQVHISDLGDSVSFYDSKFADGPESDLPAALTEALQKLLDDETASKGALFVYGKNGTQYIDLPQLQGHYAARLVVTQGLQWTVGVQQFVHNISCPGQPDWYPAPAWFKTAALALGVIETVKRQHAGTEPQVLKLYDELDAEPVELPTAADTK